MNKLLIVLASILLIGCAHKQTPTYFPPSATAVIQSVASAKAKSEKLRPYVLPEGKQTLIDLTESLDKAEVEVATYSGKVDDLAVRLSKAEDSSNYWHSKHLKGLKELTFWRLVALTIVASITIWVGVRTGWKFFL
jgi:hypothetical protein